MNAVKKSRGFSAIEALVILGVVVLLVGLGTIGWRAFNTSTEAADATTASTKQSAEVITTKADLEAAEKALDELNFDDESASEAESQASL